MKRYLTVLLCIVLVLLLWGCNKDVTPDETTDVTTTETVADVPTDEALTEEELRWFGEEFFNNHLENGMKIRNIFLACEFSSPENVDLGLLFREGLGEYDAVSQAEIDLYNKTVGCEPGLDYYKITWEDMSTVFQENTGLHLDQTLKLGLENLVYLAEYDAYYHCHGDTAYVPCDIGSGTRADDGTVSLYYKHPHSLDDALWCVTLKPSGDTYHFVSNLPAE